MIVKCLTELLYDNECVIVPDFGAFITQEHSSVIDYKNNHFMPPYKDIVFNSMLIDNDGLLVNYLAESRGVSKDMALELIHDFANRTKAILEVKSEVSLPDFGILCADHSGNVLFKKYDNVNLLKDSFGLSEFTYKPIFCSEIYPVVNHIAVEQNEKRGIASMSAVDDTPKVSHSTFKRHLKTTLSIISVVVILMFMNWRTENSNSNYASWNPFLYSSPNEFVINMLNTDFGASAVDFIKNEFTKATIEPKEDIVTNVEEQEVVEISVVEEKECHYFIIGASLKTNETAEICLDEFNKLGFEGAGILAKNDSGNIRVYYESYAEKSEALTRLEVIRKDVNESAWVLYQK